MLDWFKANVGKQVAAYTPSPVGKWLNGTLIDAVENSLTVEYEVRPEMTNPLGLLHGGISATMMDDLMGMAVFSLGIKEPFVTINIALDYLRSAHVGDKVRAKAEVIRQGKSVIYLVCELSNAEGKVLVRCSSNMVRTGSEKTQA